MIIIGLLVWIGVRLDAPAAYYILLGEDMSNTVMCENCAHKVVCKHRDEFMDIQFRYEGVDCAY